MFEMELEFEWDSEKELDNFMEHGVHFKTAINAFYDHFRMERHDDDSSEFEERWQTMGFFNDVLFVVYTERADAIRIISAG